MNPNITHEDYLNYRYCRDNGHDEFLRKAYLCTEFYFSRQWDQAEKARLEAEGRPAVTVNRVFRAIDSIVGIFLDNRIDVRHIPARDGRPEIADVLDKVYLSAAQKNKLDQVDLQVFERGLITSRGYWDVRMDFDDNMMGHVCITEKRPQNVVLDPEIEQMEPKHWPQVFTTSWLSLHDVERYYGKDARDELKDMPLSSWLHNEDELYMREYGKRMVKDFNPDNADKTLIRGCRIIERQYREMKLKKMFVDVETGDMTEIPESWDRSKIGRVLATTPSLNIIKRRVSTIRWRVTAGDYVLHDEDSPYNEFTIVPYFPYFIDGETMGTAENLLDLQRIFNKALSQELHIINTSANSGWQVEEDQLVGMTPEDLEENGAKTGLVIVRKRGTAPIEKIEPNSVPQGHDNYSAKIEAAMKEVSGVSDASTGFASQYESGKAQGEKKISTVINLGRMMNSFYTAKRLVAERVRDCIQAYYTEERVVKFTGGTLQGNVSEVTVNQVTPEGAVVNDLSVGTYDIAVTPSSSRATSQEALFEQLVEMRSELGVNIPDDVLIENSQLPNKTAVLERIKELTGTGEPTEQQMRLQELEIRMMELEAAKLEADIEAVRASAKLDDARAEKSYADADGRRVEAARDPDAQRLAHERARDAAQLEEQRRKRQDELAFKLTELEKNHAAKLQEIRVRREQAAATKAKQQQQRPTSQKKDSKK